VNGESEPPPRPGWATDDNSIQCSECCERIHRWIEEDPITQGGVCYRNWICPKGHRNRSMIDSRGTDPRGISDSLSGRELDYAVAEHVFGWLWYWHRPPSAGDRVRILVDPESDPTGFERCSRLEMSLPIGPPPLTANPLVEVPHYSTDRGTTGLVEYQMGMDHFIGADVGDPDVSQGGWSATFYKGQRGYCSRAPSAAEAICRAALKAKRG
jgi:hypothetical protein